MTDYTATPEQWAEAECYGDPERDPRPIGEYACILELRARIEALEAVHPKPPSLKEQALVTLDDLYMDATHYNILRNALEALPD